MSLSDKRVNTLTKYERNVSHFCTLSRKKEVVQDIRYHNSSQEQHDLCKTSENKNKGLGSYVVKKATFQFIHQIPPKDMLKERNTREALIYPKIYQ